MIPLLGYERWENFEKAVNRAMNSCETSGINISYHFREVTKMIGTGKGAHRPVKDYMLTRYACYLIAQNGDPKKEEIAFAYSYFAIQTRKQELIEERIAYIERTEARGRLRESEKQTASFGIFEIVRLAISTFSEDFDISKEFRPELGYHKFDIIKTDNK